MTALDDLLAEVTARCVCPNCATSWEAPTAATIVAMLGRPDGTVSVWCEECQQKPRPRAPVPSPGVSDDPWAILCPDEYRLTSEGGRTDRERLKRAWGQKPDLTRLGAGQICELVRGGNPVLLAGSPGTMKTRIAWRMVRMVWDAKAAVRCFSSWRFQADLQEASGEHNAGKWMADLMLAELVFIDDLGKAEWTANTHGAFFELVEARIVRRKPLLITTNETYQALSDARAQHKAAVAQSSAAGLIRRFRDYATTVVMQKPEESK